ncbi:hypothetical protein ACHAXT_012145 [Thalassiosira profunda]
MMAPLAFLSAAWLLLAAPVEGFQSSARNTLRPRAPPVFAASGDAVATEEAELTTSEIRELFALLADETILFDPSRGTCCRNRCSGCTYLDASGNFAYDEHTADDGSAGWLAPYAKVDFGEIVQTSTWSKLLFPSKEAKEVEKEGFAALLGTPDASPLAMQSLWNVLSPSAGYPRLSPTEIIRAIKGLDGSAYEIGGAAGFDAFEKGMHNAAEQIMQLGGVGGGTETIDYDAMSKEELLELFEERGMKASIKMKRILIEELRFYDANGRQGKRHPVKNTLS